MPSDANQLLLRLAQKYLWWKTPQESLAFPRRVIAQVMNLGEFGDVNKLAEVIGNDRLLDALRHAEPGQFSERSWEYWHYRLGLAEPEKVPHLPRRVLA
jgi:hypothetical protein